MLEILEGHFGHVNLGISVSTISTEKAEKKTTIEEKTSDIPEKPTATLSNVGSLATAELVFPLKSIPTVIAGLPEPFLLLCGPETLSQYCCQLPSCSLEFSQKAAACNHIHCAHLNIALACLYSSFENNPKMQWYSASCWEQHTLKHSKENLPIHPSGPEFSQEFACVPRNEATPSTSRPKLNVPHAEVIHKQAEAGKQFLKEEGDLEGGQTSFPYPSAEGFRLSSHEATAPKCSIKQGLVKPSKKLKEVKTKDKDE